MNKCYISAVVYWMGTSFNEIERKQFFWLLNHDYIYNLHILSLTLSQKIIKIKRVSQIYYREKIFKYLLPTAAILTWLK